MQTIMVINCGSSSVKYQLFRTVNWSSRASGSITRIGEAQSSAYHVWIDAAMERRETTTPCIPNARAALLYMMSALKRSHSLDASSGLAAIGHRVVHGGELFSTPALIDTQVLAGIRAVIPLAPLHNPANLAGIQVALELFPHIPQVAIFDTAFHQTLPPAAYRYALPEALYREQRIRRYGFHGTSHQYVTRRAASYLGRVPEQVNLISLHLGNGASATAVRGGYSVDTSMGLTPLEGLVMGTRCGDLDPAIHLYLCRQLGYTVDDLDRLLNQDSGLKGLAGVNDMREIHRLAEAGNANAQLAREMFALRIKKYLGAYYAELGRLDAVVFTGGIGEHDAWIRQRICTGLQCFGIDLDPVANQAITSVERDLATAASRVRLLVIPTDEELEIARQSWETVSR